MKSKNLLVKLTSILMAATIVTTAAGCSEEDKYDEFMVTSENETQVLHKANYVGEGVYSAYCGVDAKREVGYTTQPQDYAYDVKCDKCFN